MAGESFVRVVIDNVIFTPSKDYAIVILNLDKCYENAGEYFSVDKININGSSVLQDLIERKIGIKNYGVIFVPVESDGESETAVIPSNSLTITLPEDNAIANSNSFDVFTYFSDVASNGFSTLPFILQ